ncbi:hypothetical protein PIB30_090060, partial [Stylosanthes scabra]|nr:hypothetical protein [Stylosanthes scabra]
EEVRDLGPSTDYLRWWYLAGRRFLAPADTFYPRPADEIPPEAIQRLSDTPPRATQVDDVPDNRRPDRRHMVGEDVAGPRRVRRMPEDGGRRGGRRGERVGGRAPSAQPRGGASSSRTHQAGPSQDFLAGLNSPKFQHTLQQIFSGDTVYRPEFDGSQRQV